MLVTLSLKLENSVYYFIFTDIELSFTSSVEMLHSGLGSVTPWFIGHQYDQWLSLFLTFPNVTTLWILLVPNLC